MKNYLRNLTIFNKLSLAITVVSGLILLISAIIFLSYDIYKSKEHMREEYSTLAKVLAFNLGPALAFGDDQSASLVLATLNAEDHVLHAHIDIGDGQRFAEYISSDSKYASKTINPAEIPAPVVCPAIKFKTTHLEVCEPIYLRDEQLGILSLSATISPLYTSLWLDAMLFTIVLVIATLLALLMARILAGVLARPVMQQVL